MPQKNAGTVYLANPTASAVLFGLQSGLTLCLSAQPAPHFVSVCPPLIDAPDGFGAACLARPDGQRRHPNVAGPAIEPVDREKL
jgi:hypothetical protein